VERDDGAGLEGRDPGGQIAENLVLAVASVDEEEAHAHGDRYVCSLAHGPDKARVSLEADLQLVHALRERTATGPVWIGVLAPAVDTQDPGPRPLGATDAEVAGALPASSAELDDCQVGGNGGRQAAQLATFGRVDLAGQGLEPNVLVNLHVWAS
jgi:hypothetical protein